MNNNSKSELRSQMKKIWQTQLPNKSFLQKQLAHQLFDFLKKQNGIWASYSALLDEADPWPICQNIKHLKWCLPRVISQDQMQMHQVSAEMPNLEQNHLGLMEPMMNLPLVQPEQLTGLIIPGMIFNQNGVRLGRGKGYYDRYLGRCRGIKVGLCFSFQIIEEQIPNEAHDVRMDYLITEKEIISCSLL